MNKFFITKAFITGLVLAVLIACYLIFRPFLVEILLATILVSIFYTPYEWLVKKLKGQKQIAAFIMCLLVILVVIVPLVNLIMVAADKSIEAYADMSKMISQSNIDKTIGDGFLEKAKLLNINKENLNNVLIDITRKASNWVVSGTAVFIKGTTNFIISLFLIVFTMFFFFIDGKMMLEKIMYWTPLPNKYDREIFKKFRAVSYSTFVSTFAVAIAQGLLGGIGFLIVGLPAFFTSIAIAFLSIVPYVGSVIITVPAGIYLLVTGRTWQGIFMLIWGLVVVANIDNLIRAYMIKGKAEVHPIFVILSILGGIALFGFWGVVLGPLVIALTVTILHIYEMEYQNVLEK